MAQVKCDGGVGSGVCVRMGSMWQRLSSLNKSFLV